MARLALLLLILAIAPAAAQEAKPVKDLPDPRYPRLDRILARFADLEREHPELVRRESIGSTHRGEEIEAVVLGRRLPEDEPDHRPVVLLHGAQHANEPAGTAALMVLIERLLASPQRSALLEDLVVWVIPVVNPDGHRRVFSGAPGWREWRKNGREPHGVDLNRNWDHRWEEDPSTRPESRNYKGPRPFSEPETRALRDLILRERPVLVVDLHSPGKITPGNVVFWPWLVKREDELGADAAAYRVIAQALAGKTETQQDGVFLREAPGLRRAAQGAELGLPEDRGLRAARRDRRAVLGRRGRPSTRSRSGRRSGSRRCSSASGPDRDCSWSCVTRRGGRSTPR
jgi:hypothetical protein